MGVHMCAVHVRRSEDNLKYQSTGTPTFCLKKYLIGLELCPQRLGYLAHKFLGTILSSPPTSYHCGYRFTSFCTPVSLDVGHGFISCN